MWNVVIILINFIWIVCEFSLCNFGKTLIAQLHCTVHCLWWFVQFVQHCMNSANCFLIFFNWQGIICSCRDYVPVMLKLRAVFYSQGTYRQTTVVSVSVSFKWACELFTQHVYILRGSYFARRDIFTHKLLDCARCLGWFSLLLSGFSVLLFDTLMYLQ